MSMEYKEFPMEIKVEDVQEDGLFKGMASPFGGKPDSYGDIVVEGAFKDTLASGGRNGFGIAMLWSHNTQEPIGTWISLIEKKRGLMVEGQLTKGVQRADEIHLLMKAGAVKGLSIGYDTRDGLTEIDEKKKIRYIKRLNLWEVSPVVFPAATRAQVTSVKSIIEQATNIRELEKALRDSGMSKTESLNVISIIKSSVRDLWTEKMEMLKVLSSLESFNISDGVEKKGVIPFRSYPLASINAGWDASAEVKKADVSDLKKMCAWYDSENADVKSAYKLPHHRASGYTTVWRGVAAAMAALLGARGGVQIPSGDKRGVYNHLKKHYAQFDKTVPEFRSYSEEELNKIFVEV